MVTIYALCHPKTLEVRYVGRTQQQLPLRLAQHVHQARRKKGSQWKYTNPRLKWIRGLLARKSRPVIMALEQVLREDQVAAEARHMAIYSNLLNVSSAAQGGTRSYVVDWTPELDARLGQESDQAIASNLGVTRKAVSYRRVVLGLKASHDRTLSVPPPNMGGWNRIELPEQVLVQLGQVSDAQLAREAGVSKKTIMNARHLRCLPSYSSTHNDPTKFRAGQPHPRWSKGR